MKVIQTEETILSFVDDHVVISETKAGVVIDKHVASRIYDLIEEHLHNDYVLILDRKNKYRLMRLEVANEDNHRERLRGIAVVAYNGTASQMAKIEEPLSHKPYVTFEKLEDAITWAKQQG